MKIPRFQKIINGLYRGGKPQPYDVVDLKNDYNINKIISLDEVCGNEIKEICHDLNIEHHIYHLDKTKSSLVNLFKNNLKDLLLTNGPVFFHCYHGKDRTGMLAAVFKCRFLGMDPKDALDEAKSLGFGHDVDPNWIKLYENLILSCSSNTDENYSTIVSNQRDFSGDNAEYLDEAHRKSFSPILPSPKQDPFHPIYPDTVNKSDDRINNEPIKSYKNNLPLSGLREVEKEMSGGGYSLASKKMDKLSYNLDMSYDISNLEKQKADQSIIAFDQLLKDLYKATDYLNLIKEPFEKQSNVNSEELLKIRADLRKYRDNLLDKFRLFKKSASKCLDLMEPFSSDTQTLNLIKVFISSIEVIEEKVNNFLQLFSSIDDVNFIDNIIGYSSEILVLCENIEDIISNRIVKHIKSNILASSWVDSVSGDNYS